MHSPSLSLTAGSIVLLNKPFGVLCQFHPEPGRKTLKNFVPLPQIYPAGRLDADSEGLVALTAQGWIQHRIADPAHKQAKTYFVQVEGEPSQSALRALREGVALAEFKTRPAEVERVDEPAWLWTRDPPVRVRRLIPTCWIRLVMSEGKNRQIRRMTAAVGFPTLRLIRYGIGIWTIDGLAPGQWREVEAPWPAPDRPALKPRASMRQPFAHANVKGRAIPHPTTRNK